MSNTRLSDPDATLMTAENFTGSRAFASYHDWATAAQNAKHPWWFRGVPVNKALHEFLCAIRAKRFDLLPSIDNMPVVVNYENTDYRAYNKVGIVFPDLPTHKIGSVFFADGNFCVESPRIQNDKFNANSDGYRIRKSKDMKKMLKVAWQYLKPLTFDEVCARHTHDLEMAVHNVRSPATDKLRDALSVSMETLMTEVQHMLASGYAAVTPALQHAMKVVAEEGSELKRLRNYKPRACFVWAKQGSLMYRFNDETVAHEIVNLGDLPDTLSEKLAVLNIAEEGSVVPDVGIRINAYSFWVFV